MLNTRSRREHPWYLWPDAYGALWVRLAAATGHDSRNLMPDFVGIQDWPCGPAPARPSASTRT
ncbi:hypothetical protein [Micromonospora aurantiaca (nom. illeg.)]|uniref:hypothetical protein n=1 Tax=Micromonospora aurantiaca (nom. illeg.) TaxID=47850 RepID=UPI0033F75C29